MRKINSLNLGLLCTVCALSVSATAGSDLSNAIKTAVQKQSHHQNAVVHMIYGGRDISRPKVATADESVWDGAPVFIS